MNLVADESVDRPVVERLRADGHDVIYIADLQPGATDDIVLQTANDRGAVLVTADKDFGELVYRLRRVTSGVILIRLAGLSLDAKAETVSTALGEHAAEMAGGFSVIAPGNVRIRTGP
jgi:predicted nuclease of predicted toxin-antitoxin system